LPEKTDPSLIGRSHRSGSLCATTPHFIVCVGGSVIFPIRNRRSLLRTGNRQSLLLPVGLWRCGDSKRGDSESIIFEDGSPVSTRLWIFLSESGDLIADFHHPEIMLIGGPGLSDSEPASQPTGPADSISVG
jgi:hypothetical protein